MKSISQVFIEHFQQLGVLLFAKLLYIYLLKNLLLPVLFFMLYLPVNGCEE